MSGHVIIATRLAKRGWYVFPLIPNGKIAALEDWPNRASNDPKHVYSHWPDGHNIGIVCGRSGLCVVDLDVKSKPLPPQWASEPGVTNGLDVWAVLRERHDPTFPKWLNTYTVLTPSGGQHLYFRAGGLARELRNTAGKLGPMIDTRGEAGYVVGERSTVDGKSYEVLDDTEPINMPAWLARLLVPPKATPAPRPANIQVNDRYVNAALEAEIDTLASAGEGTRNDQLNRSAFALARFVTAGQLDHQVAIGALTGAARASGLSGSEIDKTIRSAFGARGATR